MIVATILNISNWLTFHCKVVTRSLRFRLGSAYGAAYPAQTPASLIGWGEDFELRFFSLFPHGKFQIVPSKWVFTNKKKSTFIYAVWLSMEDCGRMTWATTIHLSSSYKALSSTLLIIRDSRKKVCVGARSGMRPGTIDRRRGTPSI